MNRHILPILLLFAVTTVLASEEDILWTRSYGGDGADAAHAVIATSDGGFLLAGYTTPETDRTTDAWLLKVDGSGNPQWSQSYGGSGFEALFALAERSTGGYVAVGYTSSFGAGDRDVYLLATDQSGHELWSRSFGGGGAEVGRSVAVLADQGLVIAGSTDSFGAGESDLYIVATDANGREEWSRTFGGAIADDGRWVSVTAAGDLLFTGATGSFGSGNRNVYLVKTDSAGTELWTADIGGGSNYDWANCVVEIPSGEIFTVGSADLHGAELQDLHAVLASSEGQARWIYRLGDGSFYDYGAACLATAGGQLLAAGTSKSAATLDNRAFLMVLDRSGRQLRRELLDLPGRQWVDAVAEVSDGYLLAGRTDGGDGADAWLLKLSNLWPQCAISDRTGAAPLTVSFEDQSIGDVIAWRWDLDGDGVVDSREKNPVWTYRRGGSFTVTLEVDDANHRRVLVMENAVTVAAHPRQPRRAAGGRRP